MELRIIFKFVDEFFPYNACEGKGMFIVEWCNVLSNKFGFIGTLF